MLFQKIEEITSDEEDLEAANDLYLGFLESLEEEEIINFSRKFMGSKSKEFLDYWSKGIFN